MPLATRPSILPSRKREGDDQGGFESAHQSSSTQLSLVPPPWDEFTTSEPFLSATRVRPPGVMSMPPGETRTKGLRSTWRGARPALVNIGTVESESVGWAI